jgi:3-deoxy-manno-octulosonate cytidylyltransferase (CMP-KDO synthetase)
MLQHVWERASAARYLTAVIVATDDERIAGAARGFGARVAMTRPDHESGTDRAAEVASAGEWTLVINIQGDEPLLDPAAIDALILAMREAPDAPMATLSKAITNPAEAADPNVVKVVTGREGDALYFSRAPVPFARDGAAGVRRYKHIGIYGYKRDFLLAYPELPRGPLEQAEKLEQLRALENGYAIRVVETDYESVSVDTPADLERVAGLLARGAALAEERSHG